MTKLELSTFRSEDKRANHQTTASPHIYIVKQHLFSGCFAIAEIAITCSCEGQHDLHFIRIPAVHIISLSVSLLSQVDELNKLACSPCMVLHSSVCRAPGQFGWSCVTRPSETLTLFQVKIRDFAYPILHLTQNSITFFRPELTPFSLA